MVSYLTTPSPRRVSFMPIPIYSRCPEDDEVYVMSKFEKHASHCGHCVDAQRTHSKGATLCAKGHAYAADVAQYVYNKDGRAYSLVDRTEQQRVRLELPADLISLRSLLRAWEEGMKLMQVIPPRQRRSSNKDSDEPIPVRAEKRRPKVHNHRRTPSTESSDRDYDFAYPNKRDSGYYSYAQPETYLPAHRQPVFYKVVQSPSSTKPAVFYPR